MDTFKEKLDKHMREKGTEGYIDRGNEVGWEEARVDHVVTVNFH